MTLGVDSFPYFIGVDVGGTKTVAGVVSLDGELISQRTAPTPGDAGAHAILDVCAQLIRAEIDSVGCTPRAIGIGSAGTINAATGVVVASTDVLAGWTGTDIVAQLHERLGLPQVVIAVDNDVNAHARGELWKGAGASLSPSGASAVVLAIGTGIGGAVILDGAVVSGAHHAAGDFGHIPSAAAGDARCSCGGVGHLEAVASGPSILRHYNVAAQASGVATAGDTREVVSRARDGETLAWDVLDTAARAIGHGLAAISCVVNPELIILAGGLAHAWDQFFEAIDRHYRACATHSHAQIPIVQAQLGTSAAVIGAADVARARCNS